EEKSSRSSAPAGFIVPLLYRPFPRPFCPARLFHPGRSPDHFEYFVKPRHPLPPISALASKVGALFRRKAHEAIPVGARGDLGGRDRKSTRLNSSHVEISYAVFCLKKKRRQEIGPRDTHIR